VVAEKNGTQEITFLSFHLCICLCSNFVFVVIVVKQEAGNQSPSAFCRHCSIIY
jgi:hypothetical protein